MRRSPRPLSTVNVMSSARWLVLSALLLGACTGRGSQGSGVDPGASGGTGGGSNLNLDDAGPGADTSAAGEAGGPATGRVSVCQSFVGLDGCGVKSVEASFSAANVLLVIDKSSSMDDQPEGFELKKWDALKTALE